MRAHITLCILARTLAGPDEATSPATALATLGTIHLNRLRQGDRVTHTLTSATPAHRQLLRRLRTEALIELAKVATSIQPR